MGETLHHSGAAAVSVIGDLPISRGTLGVDCDNLGLYWGPRNFGEF